METSTTEPTLVSLPHQDVASVMSFNSTNTSSTTSSMSGPNNQQSSQNPQAQPQQLGSKVEMVYSLLSMLGTHDKDDMSRTLLAMSSSPDSCIAMRQSGCMPLLIQLLHGSDKDSGLLGNTRGSKAARARAAAALHNIVHSHPDDKRGRREARVLRLLEQIRAHCDQLRDSSSDEEDDGKSGPKPSDIDHHPGPAIAALMKLSFDEEYRHAICTLGGLQAIAELLQVDQDTHGNTSEQYNVTMRRYACMSLTNLTFGDGTNKALLCSIKSAMYSLVVQLISSNEDLVQVAASVLRNLSWRADLASKKTLREVNAVKTLMIAGMNVKKESTLKSILSAVWNLSAHCSENKADICAVVGALVFLVRMLTYKSQTKTLAIVENGGGILRNVSSHIAVHEEYRQILRQHGCLQILLKQLRSSSLTIVSNACGTLWNLSARCAEDQQTLWDMGAVSMLRNLVHSKHKMIAMGSAAALKNLLAARPHLKNVEIDKQSNSNRPSLQARKQRALEAEIDQNLSETCDNMESPRNSPTENNRKPESDGNAFVFPSGLYNVTDPEQRRALIQRHIQMRTSNSDNCQVMENNFRPPRVPRSGSQDSVGSTHSDISHDRSRVHHMLVKSSKLLHERKSSSLDRQSDMHLQRQQMQSERVPVERGRSNLPNGRILQVMQEVAMHAGISASFPGNSDSDHPVNNVFPHQTVPQFRNHTPHDPIRGLEQLSLVYGCNMQNNNEAYPSAANNNEMEETDDQPVDYSRKYCDTMTTSLPTQPPQQQRPFVKMNNFVRPNFVPNNPNVPNRFSYPNQNFFPTQPAIPRLPVGQFNAYAETDLDSDDQPTDFSQRYSENTDDHFTDQPINYSSRYQESDPNCADCKLEEARWTNDRIDQFMPGFNDDQVKTYYTEGTPMNYLSTATSMTDLSKGMEQDNLEGHEKENSKGDESPVDETQNFGTKYGENDKIPEKQSEQQNNKFIKSSVDSSVISGPDEESPNHSFHAEDEDIIPPDQTKTYCEEGTPTCFSRVSSLSSLHSSEAQDRQENRPRVNLQLHSIEELDANNDTTIDAGNITLVPDMDESQSDVKECDSSIDNQQNESAEKEHKTVTFDDNFQVEETPLMFSRCSSLGSLSSCDGESVHSSVFSEYSRRTSAVVSPSELPDSPSETMPPSPKRSKSPSIEQDDEDIDEGDTDQNTAETEFKREATIFTDKPEESITIVPAEKPLLSILKNAQANQFENESNYSKFDTPVVYAMEGTPPNFSETSSLSGLTIDHEDFVKLEKSPGLKNKEPLPDHGQTEMEDMNASVNLEEIHSDVDKDSSDGSEGEEDILAQCISSAMPVNKKVKKSSSDHSLKKPGILKIANQQKSKSPTQINAPSVKEPEHAPVLKSRSTVDSHDICLQERSDIGPNHLHSLGNNKEFGDMDDDCVKTYAEEGTPLNFSRSASLSDVSDRFSDSKKNTVVKAPQNVVLDDSKSDGSSLYDDNDDFLSAVIQSAMPKSKSAQKSSSGGKERKHSDKKTSKAKKQLPFHPQRTSSHLPKPIASPDGVKTYAVEDTPVNFSTATSLSDLTIDSVDDTCPHDGINENCFNQTSSTDHSSASHMATFGTSGDDSVFLQSESCDSTHVYQVEGTPITFSRTESLSSLSIIDDDSQELIEKVKSGRMPSKIPSMDEGPVFKIPDLPKGKKLAPTCRPSTKQNENTGKTKDNATAATSTKSQDNVPEHKSSFQVEGTPICFSRNSSLSSLSINSNHDDLDDEDEDDEHILDDIIKSAMPKKSKPDKSKSKRSVSLSNSLDKTCSADKGVRMSGNKLSKSFSAADTVNLMDGSTDWKMKEQNFHHSHEDILISTCRDIANLSLDMDLKSSKYLKDQSNHEIAQSIVGVESKSETFSPNDSDLENTTLCSDNKLLNEVGIDMPDVRNSIVDSISSAEKVDSEKSYRSSEERISDELMTDDKTEDEICKEAQMLARLSASKTSLRGSMFESMSTSRNSMKSSIMSVENISQISFPKDIAPDMDDDLLEPVEDLEEDPVTNRKEQQMNETFIAEDIDEADESLEHLQKAVFELERRQRQESTYPAGMSAEDMLLLEQNASLVVNEIGIGREMASSTVDDDMFIDNETLSLVSNDNTSDTASEISWSHTSDKLSDYSGSTLSQSDSQGTATTLTNGPRILKPSEKTIQQIKTDPEPLKSVRGRRKPLYSRTSNSPSIKTGAPKSELPIANKGVVKLNYSAQKMKTVFNTPVKKTSPKGQNQQSTPTVNKASPSTKNTVSVANKSTTPPKTPLSSKNKGGSTPSRIPCINNSFTQNKGKVTPEKPKPPIKQRTFIKEASILPAPVIKSECNDGINGDGNSSINHYSPPKSESDIRIREKRPSGDSLPRSNRNSGESFNGSWGDSKDCSVDESLQENGYHASSEQNSKILPDESTVFKKPISTASSKSSISSSPRSSTGNLSKNTTFKGNLTKTLSGSNLKKTTSGSSLAKSGSGSALNSGNSNGNLRKLGGKELKKSESSASLKKTNDLSRPTTPVGRKLSPAITPNKKSDVSPPCRNGNGDLKRKKPVESKIAGLWKKEEAANHTASPDLPPRATKIHQGKSPNRPSALPTQISRQRTASTSPTPSNRKPYTASSTNASTTKEAIPRSSTYEKLDTTTDSSQVPSIDEKSNNKMKQAKECVTREVIGAEREELELIDKIKDLSNVNDADAAFIEDPSLNETANTASINQTLDTTVDVSLDITASDISFEPDKTFSRINNGTWKKKKSLNDPTSLPNADETRKVGKEGKPKKSKSLWRRSSDSSSKNKSQKDNSEVWVKKDTSINELNESSQKKSKEGSKLKKLGLRIFSRSKSQKNSKQKDSPSEELDVSAMVAEGLCANSKESLSATLPLPPKSPSQSSRLQSVAASSSFSYPANQRAQSSDELLDCEESVDDLPAVLRKTSSLPLPTMHMTKTEMLLARRKQSHLNNSLKSEESILDENKQCKVTTV